jgi:hypothetical protein
MKPIVHDPPNYHPDYPASIVNISEKDFWSALDPGRGRGDTTLLKRAVESGQSGDRAKAYEMLADYHSDSLSKEWNALIAEEFPKNYHARQQTVEDVMKHKLWVMTTQPYQYGREIDWNQPAVGSRIHSFYWILPLLYAYVKNPKDDYAVELNDLINQYYNARNKFHWSHEAYHPAYTGLAGSIKFIHIFPIYVALARNKHLKPNTAEAWLKLALGMCLALYRRETDLMLTNQTITNAKAFGTFAAAFPEFIESEAMHKRALRRIDENLTQGFLPDGGWFERCFTYGVVSIYSAAEALHIIDRNQPLPSDYRKRVSNILFAASQFLAKTFAPDLHKPGFGDGGISHAPQALNLAKAFFPKDTPSNLGIDRSRSYHLPDSGFSVLRNGKSQNPCYALLNHGRCDLWHCHMDLLNLDVWSHNIPFLVENSRFGSYSHPTSRLMRMPEMHNTITVDGQTYDQRYPDNMRGKEIIWQSKQKFDFVSAAHDAYRGNEPITPSAQDYRIRRSVVLVKDPGYFVVLDSALPATLKPAGVISQIWHSPFTFDILASGRASVIHDGHGMLIAADAGSWLRRTETRTDYTTEESSAKLDASQRKQMQCKSDSTNTGLLARQYSERYQLRFQCWSTGHTAGAIGCVTVLAPFSGQEPPEVNIQRELLDAEMPDFRAERITVAIGRQINVFHFDPETLTGPARITVENKTG